MHIHRGVIGTGPPLLLLNGVMMSTESWAFQVPAFSSRYRCVLHDFRGQGRSDKPPGPYEMSMHVDDMVSLLDELEIESAHLVGTSYGGEVAMMFAIAHPSRVRSLTVIASVSEVDEKMLRDVRLWRDTARNAPETLYDVAAPAIYSAPFLTPEWMDLGRRRMSGMPPDWFRALADLCDAFTRLDITRDLHKITAPTLVIAGANDTLKPPRFSEIIAREIPNAELRIIPGAGHAVFLEKAEEMNAMVLEFLSRRA